jgi:hypothetical protein
MWSRLRSRGSSRWDSSTKQGTTAESRPWINSYHSRSMWEGCYDTCRDQSKDNLKVNEYSYLHLVNVNPFHSCVHFFNFAACLLQFTWVKNKIFSVVYISHKWTKIHKRKNKANAVLSHTVYGLYWTTVWNFLKHLTGGSACFQLHISQMNLDSCHFSPFLSEHSA